MTLHPVINTTSAAAAEVAVCHSQAVVDTYICVSPGEVYGVVFWGTGVITTTMYSLPPNLNS